MIRELHIQDIREDHGQTIGYDGRDRYAHPIKIDEDHVQHLGKNGIDCTNDAK